MNKIKQFNTYGTNVFLLMLSLLLSSDLFSQTQSLTKDTTDVSSRVKGFLISLPVTYSTQTTRKYPIIIYMHGSGGRGDGSFSGLDNVLGESGTTLPEKINNGTFPDSFFVNGKWEQLIVFCPQTTVVANEGGLDETNFNAVYAYAKNTWRVDTTRIYLSGLSLGGATSNNRLSRDSNQCNKFAATLLICPSNVDPSALPSFYTRASNYSASNLPIWITSNNKDASTDSAKLKHYVDTINQFSLSPLAKLTFFISGNHDAWTATYDTTFKENGLNVYQWLLQYTNKKLVANAGPDQDFTLPTNTVTLDGSKSTVRRGRITARLWTKLTGPSGSTITSSTAQTTTVTGLVAGTYNFELKITHTDGTTARDTVVISTQVQTARNPSPAVYTSIGGYYESLPTTYNADTTKRFPLLIFLHANAESGNGTTDLYKVLNYGPPKLLNEGQFPATVTSGGQKYSFIVISPQYNSSASYVSAVHAMVNYAIANYRVDTQRVYITGLGLGGLLTYRYTGNSVAYADRFAAGLVVRADVDTATSGANPTPKLSLDNIATSDLPFWATHASGDLSAPVWRTTALVDSINIRVPSPLAKKTIFTTTSGNADAWTKTYDPLSKFWTDSVNIYQWMLSYTRSITSPRKKQPVEAIVNAVEPPTQELEIKLSPNPARNTATVWIGGKAKGKASIMLYDLQGKKLSQQLFNKDSDSQIGRTINVSSLPTGYYWIRVIVNKKYTGLVRFIKE